MPDASGLLLSLKRRAFDESQVNRDGDGQFAETPGSGSLAGRALWSSSQGVVAMSGEDVADIKRIWYGANFVQSARHLRQGRPALPRSRAAMEKLQERIMEAKLTEDVTVYRGIKGALKMFGEEPGAKVGKGFTDPSFTSTSANERLAEAYGGAGEPLVHVHVPAGFSMLRADHDFFTSTADADKHQEYTLPASTTFKVVDDVVDPDGKRHVHLLVVRQKGTL